MQLTHFSESELHLIELERRRFLPVQPNDVTLRLAKFRSARCDQQWNGHSYNNQLIRQSEILILEIYAKISRCNHCYRLASPFISDR